MPPLRPPLRAAFAVALAAAPFVTHVAVAGGHGLPLALPAALALATVQAVATGAALRWLGYPRAGPPIAAALLAVLLWSALAGQAFGPLATAGVLHATAYSGLLGWFAMSLRVPGGDVVTRMAVRLDPNLHAGMLPYTRGVAWAWCAFFALQLGVSATLLLQASAAAWSLWINVLDLPSLLLMGVGEYAVRRRRFPTHRHVGVTAVLHGVRGWRAPAAGQDAAWSATGTPVLPRPVLPRPVLPRPVLPRPAP